MAQQYSNPKRADDKYSLPDVEVFYADDLIGEDGDPMEAGWYFWYCLPGCLPDSDPYGPYATEDEAIEACRDEATEDDE